MIKKITYENKKYLQNKLLFFLFLIYPITFLLGNFSINLFLFLINCVFISKLFNNEYKLSSENRILLYSLFFLFFSLLLNLFLSNNFELTYPRVLKFILIIGFILSFKYFLIYYSEKQINKLYGIWAVIFLIIIADIIFELIFKHNIIGFNSAIPGRVASFTGREMNIGHYFSAFCLIVLSFIHLKYKNISLNLTLSTLFIIISFLIGERSNFIRTAIAISLFIFLVYEINLKYKILNLLSIIIIFILFININENYKVRYFNQVIKIFNKNGINFYLDNSIYGAHYNVAKEIFTDNPVFGVGIKNFRIESYKKKYDNLTHKDNDKRGSTHPHQIHYEFLSETGIFGYASFAIFMFISFYLFLKRYKQTRNLYQLSGMLYVLVSLLPLLPSGSFFSTYSSGLFWLNYAIMIGYIKKSN